jgi:hypothetical protein
VLYAILSSRLSVAPDQILSSSTAHSVRGLKIVDWTLVNVVTVRVDQASSFKGWQRIPHSGSILFDGQCFSTERIRSKRTHFNSYNTYKQTNSHFRKRQHASPFCASTSVRRGSKGSKSVRHQFNWSANSDSLKLPITLFLALRLGRGFPILLAQKHCADTYRSLLRSPLRCRKPPFRHVYAEPRHEACKSAENK